MIKHFIIISSSYSLGARIAVHYVVDQFITADLLFCEINRIKKECGDDVSISTHYIETDNSDWASVKKKDSFFKDIVLIDSLSSFINYIRIDRTLKGIDVAKYILSQHSYTHLELQKIVYMCYAEYLCKTGKRLFTDKIYAFKYGPVIESMYSEYKGKRTIEKDILSHESFYMPTKSRILFAEDGATKLMHITKTMQQYGKLSASQLIDITHSDGSPWDHTDKSISFSPINDDIILKYHHNETIK